MNEKKLGQICLLVIAAGGIVDLVLLAIYLFFVLFASRYPDSAPGSEIQSMRKEDAVETITTRNGI